MNFSTSQPRIDDLSKRLTRANKAYYNAESAMSDDEYDAFKDELRDLDPNHKLLQEVGTPTSGAWQDKKHSIPMTSLDKVNSPEELAAWAAKISENEFSIQEKLDGISVSLDYVDGVLVSGITRGNVLVGEDITPNVAMMKGVPKVLPEEITASVRGEIILFKADWEQHFPGKSNPRNTASGLARRQSGGGQEHLHVICYDIEGDELEFSTESDKVALLKYMGFITTYHRVGTVEAVAALYAEYKAGGRDALPYEIDGLVVKVNNLERQIALGRHGDRENAKPKGQMALKFASEMRDSIVQAIVWETGKSGRITPVAQVEPVQLAGVTVCNASLHNFFNIERLGVVPGARVLVSRRGDVIPYVEKVLEGGGVYSDAPTNCPTCRTEVEIVGKYIQCPWDGCAARLTGNIEKWLTNLDVEEFGPKLIEALFHAGKIPTVAHLYQLTNEDIASLDGMGDKSARKVLDNLHAKMELPLHLFLGSLNIPSCGRRVFQKIVKAGHDSLLEVQSLSAAELGRVDGIGPVLARTISQGLSDRMDLIQALMDAGITIVSEAPATGSLAGQSFCCTGTMVRSRGEITKLVEDNGGEFSSSVKKGLNYLIISDSNSSSTKAVKARKYGTALISEDQFINMVS